MDPVEAGRCWDGNAEAWTKLARAGWDVYRDAFNTPGFFAMLPDVKGLRALDIGCGEGHNTRLLARRGARVTAVDVSPAFVGHAAAEEKREPLGIDYRVANARELPFADGTFDAAIATMSFMDIPGPERVVAEAHRVLRPGGFLQFSICHPCFDTPHRRNVRDSNHRTVAIEVGDYFVNQDGDMSRWSFSCAPPEARAGLEPFRVPRFTRTISQWFNMLLDAGFAIERVGEPRPDEAALAKYPAVQDATVVAYFLHLRVRKPIEART